jgi:hypothetical protein
METAELLVRLTSENAALREEVETAWVATGVAPQVRGMTTLADVVGVHRTELVALRARLSALEEAARLALGSFSDGDRPSNEWDITTCSVCGDSGVSWVGVEPCVCNDCVRTALRAELDPETP